MSCYNCGDKGKSLAARLDKRVKIQRPEQTRDEYGQPVSGWVDVASPWAAIEPLRGQEYFAAKRENAEVTTRIRIRYRVGIDRTMQVVYKDTAFEVLHIINPEFANEELQLMCKERQ